MMIVEKKMYYIYVGNNTQGPFSGEEVSLMLSRNEVTGDTQCYHAADQTWRKISETDIGSKFLSGTSNPFSFRLPNADQLNTFDGFSEKQPDDADSSSPGSDDASPEVICPHCWHTFKMSGIKYISRHVELIGDPVLGPSAATRFIPMTFNPQGYSIDARGMVCQEMACPRCHLKIPESIIDASADIISIVGAPSSGKSYFLTSLIWQLRKVLPECFDYSLYDTDASLNMVLNHYESLLFRNSKNQELVALPKTELQGNDFSNQIVLSGMNINLPLPFVFSLQPMSNEDAASNTARQLPNLILYDNAGEHFEPGRDLVTNMATMHLMHSKSIFFFFDPMKESRARDCCSKQDPQADFLRRDVNQTQLFYEMVNRIKKYTGLKSNVKSPQTLIFIISKFDAWADSFPIDLRDTQFTYFSRRSLKNYLDLSIIKLVSFAARDWLLGVAPELAASSESFFSNVYFIPVSALGRMPEYDAERNMLGIRPDHLKPIWAEVPMLLHMWYAGLIPGVSSELQKNCREITNYQMAGRKMAIIDPATGQRKIIPELYWGAQIFDSQAGEIVRLASPEKTSLANADGMGQSSSDDDFWLK